MPWGRAWGAGTSAQRVLLYRRLQEGRSPAGPLHPYPHPTPRGRTGGAAKKLGAAASIAQRPRGGGTPSLEPLGKGERLPHRS